VSIIGDDRSAKTVVIQPVQREERKPSALTSSTGKNLASIIAKNRGVRTVEVVLFVNMGEGDQDVRSAVEARFVNIIVSGLRARSVMEERSACINE